MLSIASNVTLQSGAAFLLVLDSMVTMSSHPLLQVGGIVSLDGSNLVINSSTSNNLRVGDTVTIITDVATIGRFSSGTSVMGSNGVNYQINYNVGSVSLTVTSLVPEPSTWLFLGMGGLALVGWRLRGCLTKAVA